MFLSKPRSVFRRPTILLCGWFFSGCVFTSAMTQPSAVVPAPATLQFSNGRLAVSAAFTVAVRGHDDARLRAGLARALRRVEERTGLTFAHTPEGGFAVSQEVASAALVIECADPGPAMPELGQDESYTLNATSNQAVLKAPTVIGALRGLETFLQLVGSDAAGWSVPAVSIQDQPRFPWRGLMIDVCRHWQPVEVIKRNLDGMALVKLNVLHLHLTEDQGFRIESKKYPQLHELGSDGNYFTQEQMKDIIAYAALRGIRVVPEFDVPGHATSWLVSHPQLASAPGPYAIERKWGVFNPVLDPTNENVYELLEGFFGEMAALFPDAYLHIGGDENNGVQWNANAGIQAFIREHNLKDNAGLHAYFNTRVHAILTRHGKKMIGWDEILHPDLPTNSVIHSWRGPGGIAAASQRGFAAVLSNGYYIDLNYPAADHYLNDPAPADAPLTPAQRALVLGGEATMWAEWVTPEIIDSRIWPRTAAIAERLWSPAKVRDVPDMYRRLAAVSRRLEEAGLRHESYIDPALRRLAGDQATVEDLRALRTFVDLLEPVKHYQRNDQQRNATQFMPLNGLVDCARADSGPSLEFAAAVDQLLAAPRSAEAAQRVEALLADWQVVAQQLLARLPALSPRLAEARPVLQSLLDASSTGSRLTAALQEGRKLTKEEAGKAAIALENAAKPHAAVELPALASMSGIFKAVSLTP